MLNPALKSLKYTLTALGGPVQRKVHRLAITGYEVDTCILISIIDGKVGPGKRDKRGGSALSSRPRSSRAYSENLVSPVSLKTVQCYRKPDLYSLTSWPRQRWKARNRVFASFRKGDPVRIVVPLTSTREVLWTLRCEHKNETSDKKAPATRAYQKRSICVSSAQAINGSGNKPLEDRRNQPYQ